MPEKFVPHFKAGKELRERVDGEEDGEPQRQREPQRQASG